MYVDFSGFFLLLMFISFSLGRRLLCRVDDQFFMGVPLLGLVQSIYHEQIRGACRSLATSLHRTRS